MVSFTDDDLIRIASICRSLGGMPLAIELAASWIHILKISEIEEEIIRSFDLLETRLQDVEERHRSMRVVFDTTWQRLSEAARDKFAALTVFHGGFTREAAEVVAGVSLRILDELSSHALLQFNERLGRYEIHELLRQFGAERLVEDRDTEGSCRDKHSEYYAQLLADLEASLKGSNHPQAMEQIETEFENIRSAALWGAERDLVTLWLKAMPSLGVFIEHSGREEEGEKLFTAMEASLADQETIESLRLRIRLKIAAGNLMPIKRKREINELIEESRPILNSLVSMEFDCNSEEARLLTLEGDIAEDPERAFEFYERALKKYKLLGDRWNQAGALLWMGDMAQSIKEPLQAIDYAERSLSIFRSLEFGPGVARCLARASASYAHLIEFKKAEQYLQESVEISEEMGDLATLAWTLVFVGYVQVIQGKFDEAEFTFKRALSISQELGLKFFSVYAELEQARILNHKGHYGEAGRLAVKTLEIAMAEQYAIWTADLHVELGSTLMGQGDLKSGEQKIATGIRVVKDIGEAGYLVYLLPIHAICLYATHDYSGMRTALREIRYLTEQVYRPIEAIFVAPVLALLNLVIGRVDEALAYYTFALGYGYIANSSWYHEFVGKHVEVAVETLRPEEVSAARERGMRLNPEMVIKHRLADIETPGDSFDAN